MYARILINVYEHVPDWEVYHYSIYNSNWKQNMLLFSYITVDQNYIAYNICSTETTFYYLVQDKIKYKTCQT